MVFHMIYSSFLNFFVHFYYLTSRHKSHKKRFYFHNFHKKSINVPSKNQSVESNCSKLTSRFFKNIYEKMHFGIKFPRKILSLSINELYRECFTSILWGFSYLGKKLIAAQSFPISFTCSVFLVSVSYPDEFTKVSVKKN